MELIAKGWSALKEVDRVIDYCELKDRRLIPLLKVLLTASMSFMSRFLACFLIFSFDTFDFRRQRRILSWLWRWTTQIRMRGIGYQNCI